MNSCPNCGARMTALFSSLACSAECDLMVEPSHTVAPAEWDGFPSVSDHKLVAEFERWARRLGVYPIAGTGRP